ncbi:response regulator [Bacteriovoracaceae bacterium]|nr:response regulator [Bacteriovoracaceae bacterium]
MTEINVRKYDSLLKRRNILIISIIFVVSLTNYLSQKYVQNKKQDYASIINISGRQRMLSQRITLQLIEKFHDQKFHHKNTQELINDIELFKESHQKILLSSEGTSKEYIEKNINQHIETFLLDIRKITNIEEMRTKSFFAKNILLPALDRSVKNFEIESTKLDYLSKNLNNLFIVIIFLCLILLSFLILNPLRKRIIDVLSEVEEKRKIAENALEVKSIFLANMSHEIRTPLNGILGITEYLKDYFTQKNDKFAIENLQIINKSGKILSTVVTDILDHTKIESGKYAVQYKEFHLKETILYLDSLLKPFALKKGLDLRFEGIDNLPTKINSDELRLKQILINLINNAIKFTNKGSVTVKCSTTFEEVEFIVFEIIDTGVGIEKKDLENIFQSFVQLENPYTKTQGGAGLGLSIAEKLAQLIGGKLSATSIIGEGTVMTLKIPACIPNINVHPIDLINNARNKTFENIEKALVVEDNLINQKVISRVLQKLKIDHDIVGDGANAIEMVKKNTYQLIFMDLSMPKMDGFEATRQIRKFNSDVPIFTLSANAFQEDKDKAKQAGMDEFLTKPLQKEELVELLCKYFK